MIKNYFFTAFRNLIRYKGSSLINIIGLSLSMSVCMLIIVVLLDQLSYDEFNTKKDRIFRVQLTDSLTNVGLKFAATPYPLANELVNNYSFVERAVVLNSSFDGEGVKNQTRIALKGVYASTDFFRVFDFRLKNGDPGKILTSHIPWC